MRENPDIGARKRPKRIITPARKEQNRVAQRVYRQRQKERLTRRNHPAKEPVTIRELRPSVSDSSCSQHEPVAVDVVQQGNWPAVDLPGSRLRTQKPLLLTFDHIFPADGDSGDQEDHSITNYILGYRDSLNTSDPGPLPQHAHLPTPHGKALELAHTTLLRACVSNASALGISVEEFFSLNCMSLCSPFYRPNTTMSDDPRALVISITHPTIPPQLQPTLAQILFPHHPLLDLIPLPAIRTRAIILASTAPNLLDPVELKRDIVVEGGIFCNGGQPWDKASWMVTAWFSRKWRLLLGG